MIAKPRGKPPVWLLALIVTYSEILAALTVLNHVGADLWWFGAFNLYLPQAVWAIPGIILSFLTARFARQWLWAPMLGIVWVAGPLMGFCWPLHAPREVPDGIPLRVMTWNAKYGRRTAAAIEALKLEIEENHPAVVFFQDSSGILDGPLKDYFRKWHVRADGQYAIVSRLPLGELQVRSLAVPGDDQSCVRTQAMIGGRVVALYNVHFQSPRWGLNAFRDVRRKPWYLPTAVQAFKNNVESRVIQVRALREYVLQEQGPVIVAGDLNSPDASVVCSTLRSIDLHDAFAEGGKGYGYTYGHYLLEHRAPFLNFSWMRIDHIMMSSQFLTRDCRSGTDQASDHRPVIADLMLYRNRR